MKQDSRDRRAFERVPLDLKKTILVNQIQEAPLHDISLGGLCFQSDQAFNAGSEINLGNRIFHVNAQVLDCLPTRGVHGGKEDLTRVRCEFIPTPDRTQERMLMEIVLEGARAIELESLT